MLVKNTFHQLLRILHSETLGYMVDICYNNYFLSNTKSAFNSATIPPQTIPFFKYQPLFTPTPTILYSETRLNNRVKVYDKKHVVTLATQFVAKYPSIYESENFIQTSHKC